MSKTSVEIPYSGELEVEIADVTCTCGAVLQFYVDTDSRNRICVEVKEHYCKEEE